MQFKLLQLYDETGRRLTKAELESAETFTGNLLISDWIENESHGRTTKQAQLKTNEWNMDVCIVTPIFDVVLIKITADTMRLQGRQIHSNEGRTVHTIQEWLLRAV